MDIVSPREAFALGRRKGFDMSLKFDEWDFASQRLVGEEAAMEINNILDRSSTHFSTKWNRNGGRLFVANSRESLLEMLSLSNLDEFYGVPSFAMEGLGYASDTNPRIKDNFTGNYFRISQEKIIEEVPEWARQQYGEDGGKWIVVYPTYDSKPISLQEYLASVQK